MGEIICYAIVYLTEAFISWFYFEYLFSRKKNILYIIISFILGYTFMFGVSRLNNTALNAVSFSVVNFILICMDYECGARTAILQSAFLCFLVAITEVLVALLVSLFILDFSAYTYDFSVMVTIAIVSKLLYLVFSIISARIFAPHKLQYEEPHFMFLFCLLPLLSTVISVIIIYLGVTYHLTKSAEIMIIINIFALLTVNIFFLILYNYLQNSHMAQITLQLSLQKEVADTSYYKAQLKQIEDHRVLVHDIRNHLQIIESLALNSCSEDVVEYISKLDISFNLGQQVRLCDDPILNMVLLGSRDECNAKRIDFLCDIREGCVAFMDAPSITTLYGNLLSNAIEAAAMTEERLIELTVKRDAANQNVVIISVENSCSSAPLQDTAGLYLTRKKDSFLHGVGLKSIERIVKKYDGIQTLYYDAGNKKFHHVIQFPLL